MKNACLLLGHDRNDRLHVLSLEGHTPDRHVHPEDGREGARIHDGGCRADHGLVRGGEKRDLVRDAQGVRFYTKAKVVTTRWPKRGEKVGYVGMNFPTNA